MVGIDLSGDPAIGEWPTWAPALSAARAAGLGLTLHAAELYRPEETAAMLDFRPERLGHMCCLNEQLQKALWVRHLGLGLTLEVWPQACVEAFRAWE